MDWILEAAEYYRAQIRQGAFFKRLDQTKQLEELQWVHQLVHQSREFTQALCLRSSLCRDRAFQPVFSAHAVEEADHPNQLVRWMRDYGFLDQVEAGDVPPTPETIDCLSFSWRTALYESAESQVVVLNVLSEGVALDFYTGVIPVLERLNALSGKYWTVHREVDAHHLTFGLDRCADVTPDSQQGQQYQRLLWHAAGLYNAMLSAWVGARAEALLPWRAETSQTVSRQLQAA